MNLVFLHGPPAAGKFTIAKELEQRVSLPPRVAMGKVTSIEGLHKQLSNWNCTPVPRDNCITIVTTNKQPIQCAEEIIEILKLKR